jgi:DNA polymerase-1
MNIAYQAFYAYNKLSYKGKPTHIIFGFPQILKGLINQYRPEKVVVCWEGERHPERLKACPGYKGHRADRPKSMSKAIKRTQILLKNLGIAQAYNPNMEGDDMIYWVTKKYQGLYKIVIASGDKDMHQLINHDITVFCPRRKLPFTPFAFLPDHGCEMFQYVDYLCLVGDKSDDIPGYRGIGPVRASAFFTRFKSIKEYLNNPNAEFSGISDKELLEEIYTRNKIMIDLEHFNTKFHSKKDVTFYKNKLNPAFKEDRVRAFCVKYNLRTFLTDTFLGTFKKLSS